MEIEERYETLVGRCLEKDKFIRRIGDVLRGCRCGIVPASLLEELTLAESQLEKSEYLHLLTPQVHGHTRIRLQGDTISSEKYSGQIVSLPVSSSESNTVAWSSVGALGALSTQLLNKQDDRPNTSSTNFNNSQLEEIQYVQVTENRSCFASASGNSIPANFVPRSLEHDNRYVQENISQPRYMSQVVVTLPQTDQFQGRVSIDGITEGYDGNIQDRDGHTSEAATDRYAGHINETRSQFTSGGGETHELGESDRYLARQGADTRNLLNNLTEFTYQNFVENVPCSSVSPAESNSEMYARQNPVISMHMSDSRGQVTASQPSADSKSKASAQKTKRESPRPVKRAPMEKFKHHCHMCGKGFAKPSKLNEHVRTHTGEKPFKCAFCQKCFAQSGTLKYHMRIHSGEKPFTCAECGKTFAQPGQLSSHKLIHREKFFKCDLCKKSFTDAVLLERHVKIHKKERPHKCEKCGKGFLHSGNLVIHVQKCCISDDDLKCKECGEIFSSKDSLDEHDEEHSKDKPHQCDICLKRFKRPVRLKKHKSTHIDFKKEQSHMCELCGQCYGKPSLLKIHMRIHTGEKPFMCDFCGKFLGSANNLRRHVLSHTGERNFKCKECNKSFSTAHNLEYHSRVHSGLKPFKCDTCGKGFPFSFSLDRHMRTHKRVNRS